MTSAGVRWWSRAGMIAVALVSVTAHTAFAQQRDSSAVPLTPVPSGVPDSAIKVKAQTVTPVPPAQLQPPISPRRAFVTSLLLPGYAQTKLDRPTASMLFAAMEILALGMARKSAQDLQEAKRAPRDSIFLGYTINPTTGVSTSRGWAQSRYTDDRIKARRTHYEDWITAIVFNHVISAADAYVAAHLWDFRANVEYDSMQQRTKIGVSKSF